MAEAFSPTGYWAHYTIRFQNDDGTRGEGWTETFPVTGYTDVALIIDDGGLVKTVTAYLDELRENSDVPDEDGQTFTAYLEVNSRNGE